jgi:hypothetical protein
MRFPWSVLQVQVEKKQAGILRIPCGQLFSHKLNRVFQAQYFLLRTRRHSWVKNASDHMESQGVDTSFVDE